MNIMRSARQAAKAMAVTLYRVFNSILPVRGKRIVFSSSLGKSYSGNPRAIYERMVSEGLDKKYDCIWFYESEPYDIDGCNKQVKYGRIRYLYYMATAKFWIFDARQPEFLRKRDRVVYLQTWHGTPLKKLGLDMDNVFMAGETDIDSYHDSFRRNAATWDYLISQNPFSSEVFRRAFAFSGKMLETGYPRNDVLFEGNSQYNIINIKEQLGLPADKKIILYAPTWRDDEASGIGRYRFSSALDIDSLKEEFEGDMVLVIKYHYLVNDNTDWSAYKGFVYMFDQSVDIASLYIVSDMLVTDYSSVMFDYSLLGKPMYFYCYDLERYKNELRGFYFDFENSAPGPISTTTDELIEDIKQCREQEYVDRYDAFARMYNPWDDGNASHKVIKEVLGIE